MLSIWLLCHALISIDGQWMVMSLFGVGWLVKITTVEEIENNNIIIIIIMIIKAITTTSMRRRRKWRHIRTTIIRTIRKRTTYNA